MTTVLKESNRSGAIPPMSSDAREVLHHLGVQTAVSPEILELIDFGMKIFDTPKDEAEFLLQRHPLLEGATPWECMQTRQGYAEVDRILASIAYGIYL
jgi:uncharacterized protein (DUF2384 family)